MFSVDRAEHLSHLGRANRTGTIGDGLIGEGQCVAHRASGGTGNPVQRLGLTHQALALQNLTQMVSNGLSGHGPQIELQTAREHRDGHFLRVGGGQDKFQILGGLLQGLEHRIESGAREHVDLIDHEHFKATLNGLVDRLLQELLHLIDASIGSGIELGVIDKAPGINGHTHFTRPARCRRDALFAIERFGQNSGHRGLAHAARAGEKIGMVQPLRLERIRERLHHMRLTDQLGKGLGAVLSG